MPKNNREEIFLPIFLPPDQESVLWAESEMQRKEERSRMVTMRAEKVVVHPASKVGTGSP